MKKLLISSALLLTIVPVTTAMAEDNTTERKSLFNNLKTRVEVQKIELKDRQEKLQENVQRVRQETESVRQGAKDMRVEFRTDVARVRAGMAGKVFRATVARLEQIIERIESRVSKTESLSEITVEVEAYIAAAKANIAEAKIHIAAMQSRDLSSNSTTTVRINFDKIKVEAKAAQELLAQAKQNLQKAIRALKK